MFDAKHVNIFLGAHFKLSLNDCNDNDEEKKFMNTIPYSNVVDSLMYVMVCTRLDMVYVWAWLVEICLILVKVIWELLGESQNI